MGINMFFCAHSYVLYLILKFGFYLLNSKDSVHIMHISDIVYSLTHVCHGVCISHCMCL